MYHQVCAMILEKRICGERLVEKEATLKLSQTFSPTLLNVFNPSRVSPSNHLNSVDDHSIPHPARPSAGWSHPPRFAYMRILTTRTRTPAPSPTPSQTKRSRIGTIVEGRSSHVMSSQRRCRGIIAPVSCERRGRTGKSRMFYLLFSQSASL